MEKKVPTASAPDPEAEKKPPTAVKSRCGYLNFSKLTRPNPEPDLAPTMAVEKDPKAVTPPKASTNGSGGQKRPRPANDDAPAANDDAPAANDDAPAAQEVLIKRIRKVTVVDVKKTMTIWTGNTLQIVEFECPS